MHRAKKKPFSANLPFPWMKHYGCYTPHEQMLPIGICLYVCWEEAKSQTAHILVSFSVRYLINTFFHQKYSYQGRDSHKMHIPKKQFNANLICSKNLFYFYAISKLFISNQCEIPNEKMILTEIFLPRKRLSQKMQIHEKPFSSNLIYSKNACYFYSIYLH